MKIIATADLHGHLPSNVPEGDILVIDGDCTRSDRPSDWTNFFVWLSTQPHKHKILVGGNHDRYLESCFPKTREIWVDRNDFENMGFIYLCNQGVEIEGLKIWGTPYTPWFYRANPQCTAFMDEIDNNFYDKMPEGLDLLISHGPPYGVLDTNIHGMYCGCDRLMDAIIRTRPHNVICGHIHEQQGKDFIYESMPEVCFSNISYVDQDYRITEKSQFFELEL